jgi:hypothetical protein
LESPLSLEFANLGSNTAAYHFAELNAEASHVGKNSLGAFLNLGDVGGPGVNNFDPPGNSNFGWGKSSEFMTLVFGNCSLAKNMPRRLVTRETVSF